jgi:hypothetical protein
MFLEVFAFRTLFRNTRMKLRDGNVVYGSTKWLWLGALAFHYAFFTILIRHLRFFMEPVPAVIAAMDKADSFSRSACRDYQTDMCCRRLAFLWRAGFSAAGVHQLRLGLLPVAAHRRDRDHRC